MPEKCEATRTRFRPLTHSMPLPDRLTLRYLHSKYIFFCSSPIALNYGLPLLLIKPQMPRSELENGLSHNDDARLLSLIHLFSHLHS